MQNTHCEQQSFDFHLYLASDEFFFTSLGYGSRLTVRDIQRAFIRGDYEYAHTFTGVARAPYEYLETIFFLSQNIEESWHPEREHRSSSVGDVVRVGEDYWIVAGTGFHLGWSCPERVMVELQKG